MSQYQNVWYDEDLTSDRGERFLLIVTPDEQGNARWRIDWCIGAFNWLATVEYQPDPVPVAVAFEQGRARLQHWADTFTREWLTGDAEPLKFEALK